MSWARFPSGDFTPSRFFFLDIDDQLGPLQLAAESFVLAFQFGDANPVRTATGLRPRLLGARALRTPWTLRAIC